MRIRLGWKRGPSAAPGGLTVSATKFVYARRRDMPMVALFGQRLRRAWGARPGAVGLFVASEPLRRVTYSVSAWNSRDDLQRFLRSPEHVKLVRRYRPHLAESTSVLWETEDGDPDRLWREGLERLHALGRPDPEQVERARDHASR